MSSVAPKEADQNKRMMQKYSRANKLKRHDIPLCCVTATKLDIKTADTQFRMTDRHDPKQILNRGLLRTGVAFHGHVLKKKTNRTQTCCVMTAGAYRDNLLVCTSASRQHNQQQQTSTGSENKEMGSAAVPWAHRPGNTDGVTDGPNPAPSRKKKTPSLY